MKNLAPPLLVNSDLCRVPPESSVPRIHEERGLGGEEQSICFHVGRGGKLRVKSQFKFVIEHWNPLTPRPPLPKIRIEFDDNGKQ